MNSIGEWLSTASGLTSGGVRLLTDPWTLLLVGADAANGLSCLMISAILLVVMRKRPHLVCTPVLWTFASFAFLSGVSHWLNVGINWDQVGRTRAIADGIVATTTLLTAVALWFVLPRLLVLPSPTQMQSTNEQLARLAEERGAAVAELQASSRRYRALVEVAGNVVWRGDAELRITEAHGWENISGKQPVLGQTPERWRAALHPDDKETLAAAWAHARAKLIPLDREYRLARSNGSGWRWVRGRAVPVFDDNAQFIEWVGVIEDISNRREAEERIAHAAHHDALTGLPNRVLFHERLEAAVARGRRGENFALLCLDLDRFKDINDTLGHPIGDALLRAVTRRLQDEMREVDTLARLGGDEFAIIQASIAQPSDAAVLARRVTDLLADPFELDGHRVMIGTSVGITIGIPDGLDSDVLLKGADLALYRAKAEGRGRWRFFEAEMDATMQQRRQMELDLRRAMTAGEFELFYQPIVDVSTRKVSGMEALMRWHHPDRGLVPPSDFIPLCEEIGLIVPIGEWVLRRACLDATEWEGPLKVAVNLSPLQFTSRTLVQVVAAALQVSGLAPERLELEITETVMLHDTEATLATMENLKALGVRIAMDDFGTGYSSLSYMSRFPFDKVKIDRSFTRELGRSARGNAIIRAIVDLCAGLDMTITAEGVETEGQLAALQRKGCQEAQGYLFSKPCPGPDVPDLIRKLEQESEIVS